MKTPVVLIAFNRPETTKLVFAEIREAKPPILFLILDGPRNKEDVEKCQLVREIVLNVNWECKVFINISDVNIGCFRNVTEGLNWVFDNVDEAIIIEDDCVPHPTFFQFCDEMLEKYRNDERIGMISGCNYQGGNKRGEYSYYFSRHAHISAWATWKRSWKDYDGKMILWHEVRGLLLQNFDVLARYYWRTIFDSAYKGDLSIWDYQWTFTNWVHNRLTVIPNVNLILNIGYGSDALHTKSKGEFLGIDSKPMKFPILHPPYMIANPEADKYTEKHTFSGSAVYRVIGRLIKRLI